MNLQISILQQETKIKQQRQQSNEETTTTTTSNGRSVLTERTNIMVAPLTSENLNKLSKQSSNSSKEKKLPSESITEKDTMMGSKEAPII